MSIFFQPALRSFLNTPLAMSENRVLALQSTLLGNEMGIGRVNGLSSIPEVEAQAALASLRGLSQDSSDRRRRPYQISTSGIAHIAITGDLVRSATIWDMLFGGVTSYEDIADQILFANEDADCRAAFVQFNSCGGRVDGMLECADFIYSASARFGGKPIYAYAADYALSAAYLLFAACDEQYGGETCDVGSIGVKSMYLDFSQAMAEDGVKPTVFRSRPGKALLSGVEPAPKSEIERVQDQINYLGSVFEGRVARYRPAMTESAVASTNALDYIGPRAKAIGLVNEILSMPEAWAKLERETAR